MNGVRVVILECYMPTQCPLHTGEVSSKYLKGFKVMVRTKCYNFWRLGEISWTKSELSFMYPTPLSNAFYNLTSFLKVVQRV